ncbi:galactose-1-phosphate uridylyltransferase [hydrocarbon metagenome]|uniref:Galactose-1-phosphate uridylyltransferase n=1 Tax=hydrocarbon metagenome TaxID=938273 RepID=A0A0W8E8X5_9ZZZZ
MTELRRDMVRDSWVLIANGKALKPSDFPIYKSTVSSLLGEGMCPFCEGNEALTTGELDAFRTQDSLPNQAGWLVRAIPNKFAMFKMNKEELEYQFSGIYSRCNGLGHHEVVIETPQHGIQMHELPAVQLTMLLKMLQKRFKALAVDPRVKYIQIYKNKGLFAGASQDHSHSQILAYPMVPDRNKGIRKYFNEHQRCLMCQMIQEEIERERIIYESDHFIILSPYAPRFSYEAWIIPKQHQKYFADINDAEIKDLQAVLKGYLGSMLACLDNPSYNVMINSAPVNISKPDGYHWYIEIIPRLVISNAVEIASGYFINPVDPETAAEVLRDRLIIEF